MDNTDFSAVLKNLPDVLELIDTPERFAFAIATILIVAGILLIPHMKPYVKAGAFVVLTVGVGALSFTALTTGFSHHADASTPKSETAWTEPETSDHTAPPRAPRADAAPGLIFADSDRREVTVDEILSLTPYERRIARNEIYARKGRYFRSADLKAHFGAMPWYRPHSWTVTLSDVEFINVSLIEALEES